MRLELGHVPSGSSFWIFGALSRELGEELRGGYRREGKGVTQAPGLCFSLVGVGVGVGFSV